MPIDAFFYWPEHSKKNPFTTEFKKGILRFVAGLESVTDIPMKVTVRFIPAMLLPHGSDDFAYGHCYYEADPIVVHVAADMDTPVESIYDTIAHEIVHVEQVRDGREITERGVKVRARNLVRKVLEEIQ